MRIQIHAQPHITPWRLDRREFHPQSRMPRQYVTLQHVRVEVGPARESAGRIGRANAEEVWILVWATMIIRTLAVGDVHKMFAGQKTRLWECDWSDTYSARRKVKPRQEIVAQIVMSRVETPTD